MTALAPPHVTAMSTAIHSDEHRGRCLASGSQWFVLLTARVFSGVIREVPDRLAGIAMLTIAVCAVASLVYGVAFR